MNQATEPDETLAETLRAAAAACRSEAIWYQDATMDQRAARLDKLAEHFESGGLLVAMTPTTTTLRLTFPWRDVASKNQWLKPRRGGGLYLSREYRSALDLMWGKAKAQIGVGVEPFEGDVEVRIAAYPPSRRWDGVNVIDPTLDALQGVCYANDRQVARLAFEREYGDEDARLEVEVGAC